MARSRVTQADVAARAGVSPTTVSLVLNSRPGTRLSDDAAERVRQAAVELGYRPNLTARALSTRRSHTIGLVSDLAAVSREASALLRGALRAAHKIKYTLFIAETDGDPEVERESIEALLDRQVDGLIYAFSRSREVTVPSSVAGSRLVLLNALGSAGEMSVLPDEYTGGRSVVELLVDAGHRDGIAVIGAGRPTNNSNHTVTVRRRLAGMWDAFGEHHVAPFINLDCEEWELASGYAAANHLLSLTPAPRAVICLNDRLAFGAFRAFHQAGLRIPADISIASFDDDVISHYTEPELTTVGLPYVEMGELAVQLLMNPAAEPGEHLVPMPLCVRGSVSTVS